MKVDSDEDIELGDLEINISQMLIGLLNSLARSKLETENSKPKAEESCQLIDQISKTISTDYELRRSKIFRRLTLS